MFIKKICVILITLAFFLPAIAHAGSCPSIAAQIDSKISSMDTEKYEMIIAAATMLKDQGILEHKSGSHKASEDLLNGALRLLDV